MKGFGLFVLSVLFLAALLFSHSGAVQRTGGSLSYAYASEARFAKMGTLASVIQLSYEKTDRVHIDGWKTAVQYPLAEEYGASVLVNETSASVACDDLRARAEFLLK